MRKFLLVVIFTGGALFLTGIYDSCYAQLIAAGRVKSVKDSTIVPHASVVNRRSKLVAIANSEGAFSIRGELFDSLVISSVGFKTTTVVIDADFFLSQRDIYLSPNDYVLEEVTIVENQYQSDSLSAREAYELVYKGRKQLVERRNTYQGFGISFSPITFLSREARLRRQYLKRFEMQEKQEYVSYRFSRAKVARWTGLSGDSLTTFLIRYRPSYEFCKDAEEIDLLLYVNKCLKEFMKREE